MASILPPLVSEYLTSVFFIGFALLIIVAWRAEFLTGLRLRLWPSYSNLPGPDLFLANNQPTSPLSQPRGVIHSSWFSAKGKTLLIRIPPYLKPAILTADPAFAAHLQRNVTDFEISARMGVRFSKMGLESCISSVVGDPRRRVKRLFETNFSAAAMRSQFPHVLAKSAQKKDDLLERTKLQPDGQCLLVNMRAETTRIMVDVVSKCYLGTDFDSIRTGEPSEMERRVRAYYATRMSVAWWDHFIPNSKKMKKVQRLLKDILTYAEQLCLDAKSSPPDKAAGILAAMCRNNSATDLKHSQRLTDAELTHNVAPVVIGSTDVMTISIIFTLHCIATHPNVQSKLRKAFSHLGDKPSLDEINRVSYFDNVIEEAMRLHQPYENIERLATQDCVVPLRYPVKGKNGDIIDSVVVPRGTEVWVSLKCLNSDRELYGQDADVFRPERFTDGSVSAFTEQMGFTWGRTTMFWGGGRGCPVFNYALASLKSVVFTFVQSFEISEPEGQIVTMGGDGAPSNAIRVNGQTTGDIPMLLKPISVD